MWQCCNSAIWDNDETVYQGNGATVYLDLHQCNSVTGHHYNTASCTIGQQCSSMLVQQCTDTLLTVSEV